MLESLIETRSETAERGGAGYETAVEKGSSPLMLRRVLYCTSKLPTTSYALLPCLLLSQRHI